MANTNAIPAEAVMELIESAYMEGLHARMEETPHFQWLNSDARYAFLDQVRSLDEAQAVAVAVQESEQEKLVRILADMTELSVRSQVKITQAMMEMVQLYLQEMLELADAKPGNAVHDNNKPDT